MPSWLTSVTTPKGNRTTCTYFPSGQVKTVADPRGNVDGANPAKYTTAYSHDAADRVKTVTDALGHTTSSTHDADGNRTAVKRDNTLDQRGADAGRHHSQDDVAYVVGHGRAC
ncbi:RHS repeat domain-containing protein [Streptomyces sp. NPDC048392]|uniref:RHS repeat domain-containing protein n=1 Tax=Streptomyces sp. NPDC048392 TaxID=3365543 RepID=UPI003723E24E